MSQQPDGHELDRRTAARHEGDMKRLQAIALLALLAVTSTPRSAGAYTLLGGQTLGVRDFGIHVQVGYPELRATLHVPVLKQLEINPRLRLYYAPALLGGSIDGIGSVGNTFGVQIRWHVFSHPKINLAVVWEPALYLNYTPGFGAGMRIGAAGGVVFDVPINATVAFTGGMQLPITFAFTPGFVFALPIEFDVGVEIALTERTVLSVSVEVGPVISAASGHSFVGLDLSGLVGVEHRF